MPDTDRREACPGIREPRSGPEQLQYLEAHDEDAQGIQHGQAHLRGDVGLQEGLAQHVSVRVAVGCTGERRQETAVALPPHNNNSQNSLTRPPGAIKRDVIHRSSLVIKAQPLLEEEGNQN